MYADIYLFCHETRKKKPLNVPIAKFKIEICFIDRIFFFFEQLYR